MAEPSSFRSPDDLSDRGRPELDLPRDADTAVLAAEALESVSPDERIRMLAALEQRAEGDRVAIGWLAVVRSNFPDLAGQGPQAPSVLRIVGQLMDLGFARIDAKAITARLLDRPTTIESWQHWPSVSERDELRLRLELIARWPTFDERLASFVLFFFRASVYELYRPAAAGLGRHVHKSPQMTAYLKRYAEGRRIALDKPLALEGQRSRRRTLLAMAFSAYREGRQKDEPATDDRMILCPDPLPWETASDGSRSLQWPQDPLDAAIQADALAIAINADPANPQLAATADELIRTFTQVCPVVARRTLIQRIGALACTRANVCESRDTRNMITVWPKLALRLLRAIHNLPRGSFARRAAILMRLDEVIRTISLLPDATGAPIARALIGDFPEPDRRWFLGRLLVWSLREHQTILPWIDDLRSSCPSEPSSASASPGAATGARALIDRYQHEIVVSTPDRVNFAPDLPGALQARRLSDLLGHLGGAAAWRSQDEWMQSLVAFHLLDETQHLALPAAQVEAIFEPLALKSGDRRTGLSPTGSVLLGLLECHGEQALDLVDSRLIHRIDSEEALLALVPTEKATDLLSPLADAIEHLFRWRLQRESGFSLTAFLYRLNVRRPHASFWQDLLAVCADRTYLDADGRTIPVLPVLQWLADEASAGPREESFDEARRSMADYNSFLDHLATLRAALDALRHDGAAINQRLEAFVELLGGETTDGHSGRSTVLGLIQLLARPDQPVLRNGSPAWSSQRMGVWIHEQLPAMERPELSIPSLIPDDLTHIDDAQHTADRWRSTLAKIGLSLDRVLPRHDARLIRTIADRLIEDLDHWRQSLPRIRLALISTDTSRHDQVHSWVAALDEIYRASPSMHPLLVSAFWRTIAAWIEGGIVRPTEHEPAPNADEETWNRRIVLLRWAVQCSLIDQGEAAPGSKPHEWDDSIRRHWGACLAAYWRQLIDRAMDERAESRVLTLLKAPEMVRVRRDPESAGTLREVRGWCSDRYLLADAHRATIDLAATMDRRGSWMATIGGFLGRFSTIWLSLMIGAILMLDFGDPWVLMAEEGDHYGILITFLIGLGGAFGYLLYDLKSKSRALADSAVQGAGGRALLRVSAFFAFCLVYTFAVTGFLWYLLSGTDAVVHGPGAIGHIVVWSGFALFAGVFFGLLAKQ
ncbi:MAG: hypothetical protein JJU36_11655 [Phycisphaeraceae bacterium]|nr:hypothetical protein [Phycisphaeraceae bacterium]